MKLSKHIERLLLKENIVVIPDFGCFVVHDVPARYDVQERAFFPSSRTLGFTTKVTVDDYLLVQSYIDTYNLTLPDAIRALDRDVDEVKTVLYSTGTYDFEGIGVLEYANNEYNFKPAFSVLLSPSSYGFGVLPMETLSQQSVFAKADDTDPVVISIRRSTVQKCTAAAAVAVIAMLSVLPVRYAGESLQKMQTASVLKISTASHQLPQSPSNSLQGRGESTIDLVAGSDEKTDLRLSCKDKSKALSPQRGESEEGLGRYTIVLAAGITPEGAAKYVDSLRNEGINASITEGKYPQVVFGKYATSADAKNEIAKHSSHPRFAVAWIRKL